jgi:recombination protein RecR
MQYPEYIKELIDHLSKWPSVGPKTAERYAFYLLKQKPEKLQSLAQAIGNLQTKLQYCQECRALSEASLCSICQNSQRDNKTLCVVENIQDLNLIEKTKQFTGYYFVLGNLLNTLESFGPEALPIKELKIIIKKRSTEELLVGLNFSLEGESTTLYLKKIFPDLRITRLARGLPSGSDLEYADEITIANALKYKNII